MSRTVSSARASALALIAALVWAAPSAAVDTVLLEFGTNEGEEEVDRYGGAVRWDMPFKWAETGDWHLGSYVEFSVTYWDGTRGTEGDDELVDFGLTPALRYQRNPAHGIAPFVELGVGLHLHTEDGIGDRDFDIPFAFGSHFGAGFRFGDQGRYELVYRFQHLSNAGLGDENPGINFHAVQLGLHF